MSGAPDAWEDEWSGAADDTRNPPNESTESRKPSAKVTKAQRRAQQAEFNRQLWAEAEGPRETNYFLESRNVVPMRSEYKPPTVLLSRKGPTIQSKPPRPPTAGVQDLNLTHDKGNSAARQESSDEEEAQARELTLAERQAQAAKEREEKQRRYDERRKELFGNSTTATSSSPKPGSQNKSGNSSPGNLTPPGSRSATPSRSRGGRGGRRGGPVAEHNAAPRNQSRGDSKQRDLYEPSYSPKPDSTYIQRLEREAGAGNPNSLPEVPQRYVQQPVRVPQGLDGSGRGGFGFTRTIRPVEAEAQTTQNAGTLGTGDSTSNGLGVKS